MTVVAIHQPNYLPWLGYFHKIAAADIFIFLDDAQFSKNSFINRVKVLGPDGPKWLTLPVSVHLGDPINVVRPASPKWPTSHLDSLRNYYRNASCNLPVSQSMHDIYGSVGSDDLAAINRSLIETIAERLGLECRFLSASDIADATETADDRLVSLVEAVAPGGTYLSGRGGAKYQDPEKFQAAGLGFRYTSFDHPVYDQGRSAFEAGLSIVDSLFHVGWDRTADSLLEAAS